MKKIVPSLAVFFFLAAAANAQPFQSWMKAADNSFAEKDYYSAMKYYESALEIEKDRMDVLYKYAESARLFNAYTFAEATYAEVIQKDSTHQFPMAVFWLASMKKHLGKFAEAQNLFQKFLDKSGKRESSHTRVAKEQIEACGWAIEMSAEPDEDIVIQKMADTINTPFSEFAAVEVGNSIYYSSYSFTKEDKKQYPPRQYVKILKTDLDQRNPQLVSFNDDNRHTAYVAFNTQKSRIYYTLCDYVGEAEIRCEIYYRDLAADGTFGQAVKLPATINREGFTATEPNIGYDEAKEQEVLFFVSGRPGGKGKLDIWASSITEDSVFSKPFPLDSINTPQNDVTPFFHSPSQTLYFSSEGYTGLGGYDIFKVSKKRGNWSTVENLGAPLNGSYQDTHFFLNETETAGFLSSNRPGSTFIEPEYEACCNDLFEFTVKVIDLDVLTFNLKDAQALDGVQLQLFEQTGEGEHLLSSITNPDGNDFNFELKKDRTYKLLASKEGFVDLKKNIDLTDPALTQNRSLERKLFLVPTQVDLKAYTFNSKTLRPLKDVEVRLAVDGQEVEYYNNKKANDYLFTLQRGTVYQLIAAKVAYIPDTVNIDLAGIGDSMLIERKLFLRPKEIEEFPPLLLYFDNDQPDPRRRRPTTTTTYQETYEKYMARKEEFKQEYAGVLVGRDSFVAAKRMEAFFDREVKNGFLSLSVFSENLLLALEDGFKVELEIQGFTSPRAKADYNELLSKRRANCLRNYFDSYAKGALKPYLDSGQMTMKEIGYGENLAPQFISDRLDDERGSIFSVVASTERKVAIIGARVSPNN